MLKNGMKCQMTDVHLVSSLSICTVNRTVSLQQSFIRETNPGYFSLETEKHLLSTVALYISSEHCFRGYFSQGSTQRSNEDGGV